MSTSNNTSTRLVPHRISPFLRQRHDGEGLARPQLQLGGRRPLVEGQRAHAVGVDQQRELGRLGLGERRHPVGPPIVTADRHADESARSDPALDELLGRDVELAVAVAVDPEHLARDRPVVVLSRQRDQAGRAARRASTGVPSASIEHSGGEVRRRRRHDVAAGERRARGAGSWYSGLSRATIRPGPPEHRDRRREQPVVGTDEEAALDLDRDAPPVGADAGVDDREHHTVGQVLHRPHERERPARTSNGATSWVMSTIRRSGVTSSITAWHTPTNSSTRP